VFGAVEQISDDQARAILDTNVLANLAVLRAALPALRASRGRIVQVSSVNGQYATAGFGLYSASKAAVELLSEALAQELAPTGVRVTIVEPGLFGTGFATAADVVTPSEVYAPTVGRFLTDFSALPASAFGDPADVAEAIVDVATTAEPPLRLPVGADAVAGIPRLTAVAAGRARRLGIPHRSRRVRRLTPSRRATSWLSAALRQPQRS
jgi:NAD(P)-dependent dehydrogenase (short-subunit alcohol dehydrogenase family)